MTDWRDYAGLQAAQDQDMADALKWWRESPNGDKCKVWSVIQLPFDNPVMEVFSRFAQIGMTQVAIEARQQEKHG